MKMNNFVIIALSVMGTVLAVTLIFIFVRNILLKRQKRDTKQRPIEVPNQIALHPIRSTPIQPDKISNLKQLASPSSQATLDTLTTQSTNNDSPLDNAFKLSPPSQNLSLKKTDFDLKLTLYRYNCASMHFHDVTAYLENQVKSHANSKNTAFNMKRGDHGKIVDYMSCEKAGISRVSEINERRARREVYKNYLYREEGAMVEVEGIQIKMQRSIENQAIVEQDIIVEDI
ncbi:hypothetical protein FGO68_gene8002 [Halteria grandinella]|uniref:Uncharacterized protein n=1 Tax=Halteria grandinella TaxID=5974 RepID=A0A8J8NL12_HALGN|nr:hypothetical protein FGO68_gene8002 [Halteria grandinella]